MNDEQLANLVRRAKASDADAYDELIDHFGPRLFGFFYRATGSREEAEDLLQESFLRVVRSIGEYEHSSRFDAWLFRIAGNLVRDRVRHVRRAPAAISIDDGAPAEAALAIADATGDGGRLASAGMEGDEQVDRLGRALLRLNESERQVVMLRHFSSLSFARIAEMMEAPLGTVLARGHRGLAKLRELLDGER